MDIQENRNVEKSLFKNKQSLLHFEEISEAIKLQNIKDEASNLESIDSVFLGSNFSVTPGVVEFALVYEELETKYPLEAVTLLEEIVLRGGYGKLSETSIKLIFKEIVNQKKIFDEKREFSKKIVWLKKPE